MKAARPYGEKSAEVAWHIAAASYEDYSHPFLTARESVKRVGLIVATSDKGLCGGLNSNVLRATLQKLKEWESAGVQVDITCIGSKGFGLLQRAGARVVSHVTGLRRYAAPGKLIGPVKVQLDAYIEARSMRCTLHRPVRQHHEAGTRHCCRFRSRVKISASAIICGLHLRAGRQNGDRPVDDSLC